MTPIGLKILHLLPPEVAHKASLLAVQTGLLGESQPSSDRLRVRIDCHGGGFELSSPLGLAAGYDKDCVAVDALLRAGFGMVEAGTVTPLAQKGNEKPRLFRLSEDQAVINRMGFNNAGLDTFVRHLERREGRKASGIVGLNIGANKDATDRTLDYETGLKRLWGLGDYFTINISSPNTPGLRALQGAGALEMLLSRIEAQRKALVAVSGQNVPVFVKIAPDLSDREIEDSVELSVKYGIDGLIVSNTTLDRPTLKSAFSTQAGGLSGKPLFEKSTLALKIAANAANRRLVLIGAGGVSSGAQAYAKIKAGASVVQLYSALVYEGLGLISRIKRDLLARLKADGFLMVGEAVGADYR